MKKGLYIDSMTFSFPGQKKPFFDNVSLTCPAGMLHFLRGKNGSGKSTLFRIIQGTIMSEERLTGSFSLDGTKLPVQDNTMKNAFTQQVKTVVQDTDAMLAGQFTVEQNLQCAQLPSYPGLTRLPKAKAFATIMREADIELTKQVDHLSGGQRQILAVLMALQKPTKVLLLDEPTAALDPKNAHMIMRCLAELAQELGITVLIISHDTELVATYCGGTYFEIYEGDAGVRTIRTMSI